MATSRRSKPDPNVALQVLTDWWTEMGADVDEAFLKAVAKQRAAERQSRFAARPKAPGQAVDAPATAEKAARAATTLEGLFEAIRAFPHCPLKARARNTVTHDGTLGADVYVIGEGPGRDEDAHGRPFIGAAGQLLNHMLASIGLSRETNCFITNVNYWRPPNNANPSAEVLAMTLPFARRMIALSRPKLIISVGAVPTQALLGTSTGIMKLRGQEHPLEVEGAAYPVLPIFHPAFLLRQPRMKALAWRDLLAIERRLDEPV